MQYLTQLILAILLLWNVTVSEGGSVGSRRQFASLVHPFSSLDDSTSNDSPPQGKSIVISRSRRSASSSLESPLDRTGGVPSSWSDDNSEVIGIVVEPTSKQQLDNDNQNDNSGNINSNNSNNDDDGDGDVDEEILEEETSRHRDRSRDDGILSRPSLLLYSSLPALSSSFPISSQQHPPTRGIDTVSLAKLKPKTSLSFSPVGERILEISEERRRQQRQELEDEMMKSNPNANIYTNNNNINNAGLLRGHMKRILSRNARDNSFNEQDIRRHLLAPSRFNYVVPSSAFRTAKRSTNCLRKCMSMGFLHPSQCHSLC